MSQTIVIADNHPILRAGLKLVLNTLPGFRVVGEAASGRQVVKLCEDLQPDVVLMDINMPNGNGVEATRILHRKFPKMIIVGLSAFKHEEMQREIMQAGAAGFISKETDFEVLVEILQQIVQGATAMSPTKQNDFALTPMEIKMLILLAEGNDRQQIADDLSISINTVKMHFRNLYQKLDVANAHEAVKVVLAGMCQGL